jgi:hypothetical protein
LSLTNINRRSVERDDTFNVRLYDYDGIEMPSVTTVLSSRDEDKSNLNDWKSRNDGVGDNADHRVLFWYSRHLGTLGHWHALRQLDGSLAWTDDESQSATEVWEQTADEVADSSSREILYSVLKAQNAVQTWGDFYSKYPPYKSGDYYTEKLYERLRSDVYWFRDAQQSLWDTIGLTPDDVIAVEQYLHVVVDEAKQRGYGGQVDLVYEDSNGEIVVADLKSSSGCYDKHQLQGAAYGHAIEDVFGVEVDRLEVHRTHPKSGETAIHSHIEATPHHTTEWWDEGYDELYTQFEELVLNFDEHIDIE